MIILWSGLGSVAAAGGLWLLFGTPLSSERFSRTNFRGDLIPATAGVAVMAVGAVGSLGLLMFATDSVPVEVSFAGFQAAVGFGVLGLLDDLGGQAGGGGFSGHLRALRERRVTTGLVKLVGGGLLSLMIAGLVTHDGIIGVLRDGALIALAANLANLFDRAPGRSTKVSVLACVGLVAATTAAAAGAIAVVGVAAALGLMPWELREKLMQGDTGVNVTGAMLGVSAVATLGSGPLWVVVAILFGFNVVSERVSFSKVIDASAPLRAIDRFGRPAP